MTAEPTKSLQEQFLDKLNTDASFRNQFLDHPSKTVKDFGFPLELEDEKKLEGIVGYLKEDIRHIFEIPSGYSDLLKRWGVGMKMPPKVEIDPELSVMIPP